MTEKQKITVEFELEIFESNGEHEVVGFTPVFIDTEDVSQQHLSHLYEYLRYDDDAAFDLHWHLKALVREELGS